jgi:GT2 family glycosyltransferase
MITVIYSTREHNPQFQQHIKETIGVKEFEILEFINNGEKSLTQVYNEGLEKSKYDVVVFSHDDIIHKKDSDWGKKLIKHFKNSEYGIIGIAGTTNLSETGRWWDDSTKMIGIVSHTKDGKTWTNTYSVSFGDQIKECVVVDGLFFGVKKDRLKVSFDSTIPNFHFYDIDFSFNNHINGVKVGVVTNIRVIHKSIGMTNEKWEENRVNFVKKFENNLPYILTPNIEYNSDGIKLKKTPKVSVVIPTKGNVSLLTQCVDSILEKDDYPNLEILIADTGSEDDEIQLIKNHIQGKNNIRLIEYSYYNFAKINNDVVKNHVTNDTEILLFCNNDIKLINNAITKMVNVYNLNKNVGTIGCRLYYGDNTIQHSGVSLILGQDKRIHLSHFGLKSFYNYYDNVKEDVLGNTAAFMMINKDIFNKIGGFNESYLECFEDVHLNIDCLNKNLKNVFVGGAVCYHLESQTRNKDDNKLRNESEDYMKRIIPYILNNKKVYNYFENISGKDMEMLINNTLQRKN